MIDALEMLFPLTLIWPLTHGRADTLLMFVVVVVLAACLPVDGVGIFGIIGTGTIWVHYILSWAGCGDDEAR